METPQFEVIRIRTQDEDEGVDFSYKMADELSRSEPELEKDSTGGTTANFSASTVKTLVPNTPAPKVEAKAKPAAATKKKPGLLKRLWDSLFGGGKTKSKSGRKGQKRPAGKSNRRRGGQDSRGRQGNRRSGSRNESQRNNERNGNRQRGKANTLD